VPGTSSAVTIGGQTSRCRVRLRNDAGYERRQHILTIAVRSVAVGDHSFNLLSGTVPNSVVSGSPLLMNHLGR
jgi:hypothetical protein